MATKKKLRWMVPPPKISEGFFVEEIAPEEAVHEYIETAEEWFIEYVHNWSDNLVDNDREDVFASLIDRRIALQDAVKEALDLPEPHRAIAFNMALRLALMVQTVNAPVLQTAWDKADGAVRGGQTSHDPMNKLTPAEKSRVAHEMKARGHSQRDIAARLGVSTRHVRFILNGK